MNSRLVYVSITGLRLKGPHHMPRFMVHAFRAMNQAQRAPGNLRAETRSINGVHHTLSVWENEAAMRTYLTAGAHLRAMKAFPAMATGKVVGFSTDRVPDWTEVHELWRTKGREV